MRIAGFAIATALMCGVVCRGTEPGGVTPERDADVVLEWHCIGVNAALKDKSAPTFAEIYHLESSRALRDQTLVKVAKTPYKLLKPRLPKSASDHSELLRPLVEGLVNNESFLQVRERADGKSVSLLCVRLTDEELKLWTRNLQEVARDWLGAKVQPESPGWRVEKADGTGAIRFARAGQWGVVACGQGGAALQQETIERILRRNRPVPALHGDWLQLYADLPKLLSGRKPTWLVGLPTADLRWFGSEGYIRVRGRLRFDADVKIPFEPWTIPTNSMLSPMVSFTAVQGGSTLFPHPPGWVKSLFGPSLPNQLYMWAMDKVPMQTFLAFPEKNASRFVKDLSVRLMARQNPALARLNYGHWVWRDEPGEVAVEGFPFIAPKVSVAHEPTGDFVVAGLFPNSGLPEPLPAELLGRVIGQTNLVYYDWEITSPRLLGARYLTQLAFLTAQRVQLGGESRAMKWLLDIEPKVGPTVTEIKQVSPREFSLARKGHLAMTAIELVALANWIESPSFPGWSFQKVPPRSAVPASSTSGSN